MRKQSKEINITIIGVVVFVAFIAGYTTKGYFVDYTDAKVADKVLSNESSRTITGVTTKKIEAEAIISESEKEKREPEEFTFTKTLADDKPKKPVDITPAKAKTSVVTTKTEIPVKKEKAATKNSAQSAITGATYYAIQVGSFADNKDAESLKRKLASKGYDAFIVVFAIKGKKWSRVRVGGYRSEKAARRSAQNLVKRERLPTMIVSYTK